MWLMLYHIQCEWVASSNTDACMCRAMYLLTWLKYIYVCLTTSLRTAIAFWAGLNGYLGVICICTVALSHSAYDPCCA